MLFERDIFQVLKDIKDNYDSLSKISDNELFDIAVDEDGDNSKRCGGCCVGDEEEEEEEEEEEYDDDVEDETAEFVDTQETVANASGD